MMFQSNQGTDDHVKTKRIEDVMPYQSVIVQGEVSRTPERRQGGHIIFGLSDEGDCIDCAAYEPTKEFRHIVQSLVVGDKIMVYGGVRAEPMTVNIEKIKLNNLVDVFEKIENPVCPICGKHMKSKGKNQGFSCRRCHTFSDQPVMKKRTRSVQVGFYEVPVCARRHLAKPIKRFYVKNKQY
jgi:tRNA(Ile2)-agmatinylcytidine synthase